MRSLIYRPLKKRELVCSRKVFHAKIFPKKTNMKFSYTALGSDNQKLTGTLMAESLELARNELHKMGLSVIALNEVKENLTPTKTEARDIKLENAGIVTYFFLTNDPEGKTVNGTIDAKDPYSAYKRLIAEYQFQVLDLYDYASKTPDMDTLKGQFENWNLNLEQEGIDPHPKRVVKKNDLTEEGEKMAQEIVEEIDHFILNTKKILKEHQEQYSKVFLQEIEGTLGKLERIRSSNNLKHITKVCNDLYELISHPDALSAIVGEKEADQEYKQIIGSLKESGFVQNKFNFLEKKNLEQKAERFESVKGIFSKIQSKLGKNTGNLEKNLQKRNDYLKSSNSVDAQSDEVSLKTILSNLFSYLKETNPILRRARKQDLRKSYELWKNQSKEVTVDSATINKEKRDFSQFFMELDSFFGWLLFFYLSYFFLISFSLERDIGLPKTLVFKTLSSPLIINVSIFLLVAHLALKLKLRLFQRNALGSFFLFSLFFGAYILVMANF